MFLFWIAAMLFTNELVPATRWYHVVTYLFNWPCILGQYVKEKIDE